MLSNLFQGFKGLWNGNVRLSPTRCTGLGVVMRIPVEAQLADMIPTASSGVTEYA